IRNLGDEAKDYLTVLSVVSFSQFRCNGFDQLLCVFCSLCVFFFLVSPIGVSINDQVGVVLRGYSGYNTRWALKVLESVFPAKQGGDGGNGIHSESEPIAAVTVFFGANDASLPDRCSAFQRVPLHEYKHNLHSIVSFFKKRWPNAHVLLITPPPIDEDALLRYPYVENKQGLPERTNEAAGEYARACTDIAGECGVLVIDLWTKMQHYPEWKKRMFKVQRSAQGFARPLRRLGQYKFKVFPLQFFKLKLHLYLTFVKIVNDSSIMPLTFIVKS
ncbi:GDSL esterase/lipase At5g45920-like, partial [Prosopis cineraria]|uniref:GDSL esterase/lipase At5g45920-like n=1 Tax=Prosopis cineraria TaxID=364024 RepID=UPI00240ED179